MIKENVQVIGAPQAKPATGSAGLRTQLAGKATTVSGVSAATGGIGCGKLVERDTK